MDSNEGLRLDRLRAEYGSWFIKRNGRWVLNDGFWAAWLCGRLGLFFDQDSNVFRTSLLPITQAYGLSADALIEPVRLLLVVAAKQIPAFPTKELRDVRVRHLIEIMKVVPGSEAFRRVQ